MAKRSPSIVFTKDEEKLLALEAEQKAVFASIDADIRRMGEAVADGEDGQQAKADIAKADARLKELAAAIDVLNGRLIQTAKDAEAKEDTRRQEARRLALTELQAAADEVDAVFRVLGQKVKVLAGAVTKANAVCDGETRRELAYGGQSFKYHLLWHVSNMPGCTVPYSAKIPPFRDRFPAPPMIEKKG